MTTSEPRQGTATQRLKRLLKPAVFRVIAPVARVMELRYRWSDRRAGLVLYYHRVGDPQGDADREILPALGTSRFDAHVRHLKRRYRVVAASEILAAASARRRGQRFPIAITFDDDRPDYVRDVMPILKRHGAPATFFLNGASLERPFGFWWDHLQRAWDQGTLDRHVWEQLGLGSEGQRPRIQQIAEAIEGLPPERRRRIADELAAVAGPDPPDSGIRAEDVRRLAEAGFEIGFHTLLHDPLTTLDDEGVSAAMSDGREALEQAAQGAQGVTSLISYPNGKADGRVAAAARSAGYSYGFTAFGCAADARSDPLLIDRIDPLLAAPSELAFRLARALRDPWAA